MALQPVIYDMGEGVLAREIKVEGLGAPRRAEDAPYTSAPYKAAAPNPSAQWPLAVLAAAHRCPCCARSRDRRWSLVLAIGSALWIG